eukprot:CAMPEP_0185589704 /NCGR_PEP_ID=MMETSP0434-20130131/58081_1 /TAXON_ID=626734 ORGANISM="Favella taraikaensis, Strain Fe Narragansett Bay" /NCGR_SAMPLE_ID=MMETSP0434 /ASSEMBLY_ACC=CAM_ASM_000379 /LENGTH=82 /DNA_ID=CAMNT_0028213349 /DNA_START=196 /DNA_END=444 /DNA_ORIENTATION=+
MEHQIEAADGFDFSEPLLSSLERVKMPSMHEKCMPKLLNNADCPPETTIECLSKTNISETDFHNETTKSFLSGREQEQAQPG